MRFLMITITEQNFLLGIQKRFPEKYHMNDYSHLPETLGVDEEVEFKCKVHGPYIQKVKNHRSDPAHCKDCAKERWRGRSLSRLKRLLATKVDQDTKLLEETYRSSSESFKMVCRKHGEFTVEKSGIMGYRKYSPCIKCNEVYSRLSNALGFEKDLLDKFGDTAGFNVNDYINNKSVVKLTCPEHGDISGLPGNVLKREHLCSVCAGYKLDKASFVARAKELHSDKYDYSKVKFVCSSDKVTIICRKHGQFMQTPFMHLNGRGCSKCAAEDSRISEEEFLDRAKKKHGNKYKYSNYKKATELVTIECPKHGYFEQKAASHLDGRGCKKCGDDKQSLTTEEFISRAKKVHGDKYDYTKTVYRRSDIKVTIACKKHGDFLSRPGDHLQKRGCPKCKESKGETAIRTHLENQAIEHVQECMFDGCGFRWDFYLPDYDLFIEFHGQQHYGPVERFGGMPAYRIAKANDKTKVELLTKLGANMLIIKYDKIKSVADLINKKIESLKVCDITKREFGADGKIRAHRDQ